MPTVSPLINRGQVGYWLENPPTGGKLLTVDTSGNVIEATTEQVQTAADLQAALAAELADIDGGTPSTTFTEEIDGGTP